MPSYEFQCPDCKKLTCIRMKVSDLDKRQLDCEDCLVSLERVYITPSSFNIPSNSTFDGKPKIS